MITPAEFRSGQHSIPLNLPEELPECCSRCRFLIFEEFTVCFIDAPFYYQCAYQWTETGPDSQPPCLAAEAAAG